MSLIKMFRNSRNTLGRNSRDTSGRNSRDTSGRNSRDTSVRNCRDTSGRNFRDTSGRNSRDTSGRNFPAVFAFQHCFCAVCNFPSTCNEHKIKLGRILCILRDLFI